MRQHFRAGKRESATGTHNTRINQYSSPRDHVH